MEQIQKLDNTILILNKMIESYHFEEFQKSATISMDTPKESAPNLLYKELASAYPTRKITKSMVSSIFSYVYNISRYNSDFVQTAKTLKNLFLTNFLDNKTDPTDEDIQNDIIKILQDGLHSSLNTGLFFDPLCERLPYYNKDDIWKNTEDLYNKQIIKRMGTISRESNRFYKEW